MDGALFELLVLQIFTHVLRAISGGFGLPAALLAEALAETGDEHGELLGVRLAHLVPPVVPSRNVQVGGAPLHLAARAAARRAPPRGHRVRGAGGTAHGSQRRRVLVLFRMRRQRPVGLAGGRLAGRRGGGERGHGRRRRARRALAVHGGAVGGRADRGEPARWRCSSGAALASLLSSHERRTMTRKGGCRGEVERDIKAGAVCVAAGRPCGPRTIAGFVYLHVYMHTRVHVHALAEGVHVSVYTDDHYIPTSVFVKVLAKIRWTWHNEGCRDLGRHNIEPCRRQLEASDESSRMKIYPKLQGQFQW